MESLYRTPRTLVDALQNRAPEARAQFWQLMRKPLAKLMDKWIAQHGLERDRELLTENALFAAETYFRTCQADQFDSTSWNAFQAAAVLHVAKFAFEPFGNATSTFSGLSPLPFSTAYHSEIFFQPYERLGTHWFGGDWFAGHERPDGTYWVILADVTGHGYHAYLLACALPGIWQRCWSMLTVPDPQPAHLLQVMHQLIEDCLPEGVYLECTLARLGADGSVTVGPAGGTRLLVRHGSKPLPDLHQLRGAWLGLRAPDVEDQRTWVLEHGDELLLATDGIFDQLDASGEPSGLLGGAGSLFEVVRQLLDQALQRAPQKDDMTMVLLRRVAVPLVAPSPGREGR